MRRLHDLQAAIGRLAFDETPDETPLTSILDDRPIAATDRLRIHRNNSLLGLTGPLTESLPVVAHLVGTEFFERMAQDFIRAFPPNRPDLLFYGQELPDFIASYSPASSVPYLADMARFEMALTIAAHSADCPPLQPSALQALAIERLEELCLKPLPSLRFIASDYPLLAIWRAHQPGAELAPIALDGGGDMLLIFRPHEETVIRAVSAGCFAFMMAVASGQSLASAYRSAMASDPDFSFSEELAALLAAEIFMEVVQS
jgi:hypothetical protein